MPLVLRHVVNVVATVERRDVRTEQEWLMAVYP